MNVLWQKGSASVHQLLEWLPEKPALAYNTVLTTIRILEKKGYVKHVKDGRAHIYLPLVGQREATRFAVRNLVSRFFKDSHELLVLNILEDEDIDSEELKRMATLLENNQLERKEG
jgi:predicted transcriptional regulator